MTTMRNRQEIVRFMQAIRRLLVVMPIILVPALANADEGDAGLSWEGLVALEESESAVAYIDPDADFSVFRRVAILDPQVAFRSNWLRDQNRSRTRNVRASDVERIKNDVGELLVGVFTEQLEAAGYEIVNYADEDVLILRPAIIDLDITAPDVRSAGRSRTYAAEAGAATLFIELFDSLSGDLLGRAVDRRATRRSSGWMMQSNRVSNRSAARREFRVWADRLVAFLDEHYVEAPTAE
jgi:hypothetical protein